jgi:hypothetical protein
MSVGSRRLRGSATARARAACSPAACASCRSRAARRARRASSCRFQPGGQPVKQVAVGAEPDELGGRRCPLGLQPGLLLGEAAAVGVVPHGWRDAGHTTERRRVVCLQPDPLDRGEPGPPGRHCRRVARRLRPLGWATAAFAAWRAAAAARPATRAPSAACAPAARAPFSSALASSTVRCRRDRASGSGAPEVSRMASPWAAVARTPLAVAAAAWARRALRMG